MTQKHVARSGDCFTSVSEESGHFWETLWDAPENAALKQEREDPNCLKPGDEVFIPDLREKSEKRASEARHKFRRRGVPAKLRIRMLKADGKPHADRAYRLDVDGAMSEGATDGDGMVEIDIPCGAVAGVLILEADEKNPEETFEIQLGELRPHDDLMGAQQRLKNLGAEDLKVDGVAGEETETALRAFQRARSLNESGVLDEETALAIRDAHGS